MSTPSSQQSSNGSIGVLLVEDNPGDIRLLREAFKSTERTITFNIFTDGADALDFVERERTEESPSLPDLAIVDLNLPRRDGCEVLEAIRDDPQFECLPVIMFTSSGTSEDITQCYEARANAYMTKPTVLEEFVSVVEAVEEFWFEQARLPPVPR